MAQTREERLEGMRNAAHRRRKIRPDVRKPLSSHGITQQQLDHMLLQQNGVCAICGDAPNGRRGNNKLHIDHDHSTDAIRGLLCAGCNTGIGLFRDDPGRLAAAIRYVQAKN